MRNVFVDYIQDGIVGRTSEELVRCHAPKPIILPTGEVGVFYQDYSACFKTYHKPRIDVININYVYPPHCHDLLF